MKVGDIVRIYKKGGQDQLGEVLQIFYSPEDPTQLDLIQVRLLHNDKRRFISSVYLTLDNEAGLIYGKG